MRLLRSCFVELCLLQEVERKFGKFGEVREARIVRNPHNGESRGFGFVAMERDEDVDRVTLTLVIVTTLRDDVLASKGQLLRSPPWFSWHY